LITEASKVSDEFADTSLEGLWIRAIAAELRQVNIKHRFALLPVPIKGGRCCALVGSNAVRITQADGLNSSTVWTIFNTPPRLIGCNWDSERFS